MRWEWLITLIRGQSFPPLFLYPPTRHWTDLDNILTQMKIPMNSIHTHVLVNPACLPPFLLLLLLLLVIHPLRPPSRHTPKRLLLLLFSLLSIGYRCCAALNKLMTSLIWELLTHFSSENIHNSHTEWQGDLKNYMPRASGWGLWSSLEILHWALMGKDDK